MSKYKQSLIAILKQNSAKDLCEDSDGVQCREVVCSDCPFFTDLDKEELIKELEDE